MLKRPAPAAVAASIFFLGSGGGAVVASSAVGLFRASTAGAASQERRGSAPVLFRDVDVFDGSRMIRHTSVLVRDGLIRAVGVVGAGSLSPWIFEGRGRTLRPGRSTRTPISARLGSR